MPTTDVGADDRPWVDGNALAGPLGEIIGADLTVAELTCAGCRMTRPLAAMRVFDRAPGLVARCPGCENVVMRLVRTADRAPGRPAWVARRQHPAADHLNIEESAQSRRSDLRRNW